MHLGRAFDDSPPLSRFIGILGTLPTLFADREGGARRERLDDREVYNTSTGGYSFFFRGEKNNKKKKKLYIGRRRRIPTRKHHISPKVYFLFSFQCIIKLDTFLEKRWIERELGGNCIVGLDEEERVTANGLAIGKISFQFDPIILAKFERKLSPKKKKVFGSLKKD